MSESHVYDYKTVQFNLVKEEMNPQDVVEFTSDGELPELDLPEPKSPEDSPREAVGTTHTLQDDPPETIQEIHNDTHDDHPVPGDISSEHHVTVDVDALEDVAVIASHETELNEINNEPNDDPPLSEHPHSEEVILTEVPSNAPKDNLVRRATIVPPPPPMADQLSKEPKEKVKTHSNTIINLVAFGFLMANAVQFANCTMFLYRAYGVICALGYNVSAMILLLFNLATFILFMTTDIVKYRWLGTLNGQFWTNAKHILHQNKNILLVIIMGLTVVVEAINLARNQTCSIPK
jgi:hypothetical protein